MDTSLLTNAAPPAATEAPAYVLRESPFRALTPAMLDDWRRFETAQPSDSPAQDPEWIRGYFEEDLDHISTYLLYQGSELRGHASFLWREWPMKLHLGEVGIARLPLKRLRLLGETLNFPGDDGCYDLLFRSLAARQGHDALYFDQIPVESRLWSYLTTSALVERGFHRYQSDEPSLHPRLRFTGTFDEYLKKFNKSHRHHLRRKVSRFREEAPGEVRFVRYTRPEEVDPFLDAAVEVSKKTYQWNLHGRGLRATDRLRRRLHFAAGRGWFRSYLLYCGEAPYAFLVGYQWKGRYYTDEIGFDPVLAKRSPGTVLQMMVLEDMHAFDTPELIDFGSYDKYKEEFANDSYQHCAMYLFRRTPYLRALAAGDYACRRVTGLAARLLHRFDLKRGLKKAIRAVSVKGQ
jgi:CelD/BcsL family acetyltransferase involved in cellulose biosynthesis